MELELNDMLLKGEIEIDESLIYRSKKGCQNR